MDSYTVTGGDGVNLHVDRSGSTDNPPIVFVHGYSQSRLCWKHQFDSTLRDDFNLIAFDNRGHGDSDKPENAYSNPKLWAEDLQAVIDSLDRDDPIIVAWSYGGIIVSDYLDIHGTEHISGLNFVSTVTEKGTKDAEKFSGDAYVEVEDGLHSTDAEETTAALSAFIDACVNSPLDVDSHHFMLGYNVKTPPRVREKLMARKIVHEETLEAIDVPTLLTHGDADPIALLDVMKKHASLIDTAETSVYKEVGHLPFWEEPKRFNSELRSFAQRAFSGDC